MCPGNGLELGERTLSTHASFRSVNVFLPPLIARVRMCTVLLERKGDQSCNEPNDKTSAK